MKEYLLLQDALEKFTHNMAELQKYHNVSSATNFALSQSIEGGFDVPFFAGRGSGRCIIQQMN